MLKLPTACATFVINSHVLISFFGIIVLSSAEETSTDEPRKNVIELDGNWRRPEEQSGDIVQLWAKPDIEGGGGVGGMRNALPPNSPLRWTKYRDEQTGQFVVPYMITGFFDRWARQTLFAAIDAVNNATCVRFRPRRWETDFVDFQSEPTKGCYTMVGRVPGRNVIMLEDSHWGSCVTTHTITHELLHKLGLWHEHMRLDRDQFVTINYHNIQPRFWSQFQKVFPWEATTYDVPYDYRSVMHYSKRAFSRQPWLTSMEPKDKKFQDTIGRVRTASPNDYAKICSIYKCERCPGAGEENWNQLKKKAAAKGKPFGAVKLKEFDSESEEAQPRVDDSSPEEVEEENGISEKCAKCVPVEACEAEDREKFPNFYEILCCGRCGPKWRDKWCSSLSTRELQKRRLSGMCP